MVKRRQWAAWLGFFIVWGWIGAVHADDVVVSATVDATHISLQDTITLTVAVNRVQEVESPVLPNIEDAFEVLSQGSSSSINFINGQMSAQMIYTYLLSPRREGTTVIAPISVRVGGQDYKSQPLTVTIGNPAAGGNSPSTPSSPPQLGTLPNMGAPAPSPSRSASTDPYYITVDVSNKHPVVNEQVLYTFRFYTRVPIDGDAVLKLPEFSDFYKEELVPQKKSEEMIGGYRYVVNEKAFALFPTKAGKLTLDPARLQLSILDNGGNSPFSGLPFFNMQPPRNQPKVLTSEPIAMDVASLPEPEPDGFSNLVGHFSLSVSIDKSSVKPDESMTVTFEVRGRGNIGDAVLPPWTVPEGIKVYEDKPETESEKTADGIQGVKRFKKALVPSEAGTFTLPALGLSYFDPQSGKYESLSTQEIELDVVGTPGQTSTKTVTSSQPRGPSQAKAQAQGPQFRPIDSLRSPLIDFSRVPWVWIALGIVLMPYLFAVLVLARRIRAHRDAHYLERKKSKAFRTLKATLNPLLKKQQAITHNEVEQALKAIRDYVGAKQGKERGLALSTGEIERALGQAKDVPADAVGACMRAVSALEAHLYGGASLATSEFFTHLSQLLKHVEEIDEKF